MARRDEGVGLSAARVLDGDDVQGVLSGAFYAPDPRRGSVRNAKAVDKPSHYRVICISLYTKDLERLDALVDELKARGLTKASRSALIRVALDQVDLDKVPRGL
ncbi:MAG: hypothetical protein ABTD50_01585 [Polyangiaceae bacterium]|jgi:hypothetical protein